MFNTILVGIDGSQHALNAAKLAGEIARQNQSGTLWVVTCLGPIPTYLGTPYLDFNIEERMRDAERILKPALDAIGSIPGEIKTEILEENPAEAILKVAEARHVDLILMGTRGLGSFSGLLLGSQSHKVIAHAHCPVLVTR